MVVVLVVVDAGVALLLKHFIFEMHIGLPSAARVLDIVGEAGTFNEGVVLLTVSEVRIVVLEHFEFSEGLVE